MPSVNIIENTSARLVAVQTPQTWGPIPALLSVVAGLFLLRLLWTRQWKLAIVPGLFLLVFFLLWLIPETPTFRVTLDLAGHSLTSEASKNGKVVSEFAVSAGDLSSAEMQSNRGARTIILIRKDGSLLYPLGKQKLQGEPDQYVILNAIRQFIGQAPQNEHAQ